MFSPQNINLSQRQVHAMLSISNDGRQKEKLATFSPKLKKLKKDFFKQSVTPLKPAAAFKFD